MSFKTRQKSLFLEAPLFPEDSHLSLRHLAPLEPFSASLLLSLRLMLPHSDVRSVRAGTKPSPPSAWHTVGPQSPFLESMSKLLNQQKHGQLVQFSFKGPVATKINWCPAPFQLETLL